MEEFPGDRGDRDAVLRFLAENTPEPALPKGPDEQIADILFRNLYEPQTQGSLKHLPHVDRAVFDICSRPRLWEMLKEMMRVSPSLLGTKVCSASELKNELKSDALGVSHSLYATN